MNFEINIRHSHAGVRAVAGVLVEGEQYVAHRDKRGIVRMTATNNYGEVRYAMINKTNQAVWNALVAAVRNA